MGYKKRIGLVIAAVVTVMALSACGTDTKKDTSSAKQSQSTADSQNKDQSQNTQNSENTKAADGGTASSSMLGQFEAETLQGDSVNQDIFAKADVTMVNVWATNCVYCIKEMPDLGEIGREYADKGVQIVGVITDVTEPNDETAVEIVDKTGVDYTNLVLNQTLIDGLKGNVQATPTTFFLDKNGNQIGALYAGAKDKEAWVEIIEALL